MWKAERLIAFCTFLLDVNNLFDAFVTQVPVHLDGEKVLVRPDIVI